MSVRHIQFTLETHAICAWFLVIVPWRVIFMFLPFLGYELEFGWKKLFSWVPISVFMWTLWPLCSCCAKYTYVVTSHSICTRMIRLFIRCDVIVSFWINFRSLYARQRRVKKKKKWLQPYLNPTTNDPTSTYRSRHVDSTSRCKVDQSATHCNVLLHALMTGLQIHGSESSAFVILHIALAV